MNQAPINTESSNLQPDGSPTPDSKGGVTLPSISTRHLVMFAVVIVIALIIWRVNRSRGTTTDNDQAIIADDTIEGIHIPENSDDPLLADSAVIAGLKEAGVMG